MFFSSLMVASIINFLCSCFVICRRGSKYCCRKWRWRCWSKAISCKTWLRLIIPFSQFIYLYVHLIWHRILILLSSLLRWSKVDMVMRQCHTLIWLGILLPCLPHIYKEDIRVCYLELIKAPHCSQQLGNYISLEDPIMKTCNCAKLLKFTLCMRDFIICPRFYYGVIKNLIF